MRKVSNILGGASMLAVAFATPAFAQQAQPAAAQDQAGATDANQFGDIVVTARKQEESQQSVPIAITALGGAALQQKTIQSVRDIQFSVPGLVNYPEPQGGAPDFAIRGTRQQGITGSQGGVAVYLGYVPLTSTMAIKNSNYDMQSVQVLKGPQGTLFGKNTTGGAIIFRPNEPSNKFEGLIDGNYGRWNRKDVTAMVNLPVTEGVALRIAGRVVKSDGRLKNVIDPTDPYIAFYDSQYGSHFTKDLWAEDNQSLRVSLKLQPSDNLTNVTMFDWYHQSKNQTDNQGGLITQTNGTCSFLYSSCAGDFARQQAQGTEQTTRLWPVYVAGTWWGISNVTELNLDGVKIRNIFGYRHDRIENSEDDSGVDAPILKGWNEVPAHAYTDEINVIGKAFDDKLDYTVGAFYANQTTRQMLTYSVLNNGPDRDPFFQAGFTPCQLGLASGAACATPGAGGNVATPFLPPWYALNPRWADYTYRTKSIAGFGQVNYHIDDKLTFTLGARYTHENQTYQASEYTGVAGTGASQAALAASLLGTLNNQGQPTALANMNCVTGAFTTAADNYDAASCTLRRKATFNSFIFSGGLQYQANARTLIYVNVGKGYQAGGFNNQQPAAYGTFQPETVMNFEGGLKKDWDLFNRPIRTNLAVFYSHYRNQQRSLNGSFSAADLAAFGLPSSLQGNSFIAVFNASASTAWGGELEVSYNPLDNLKLSGFLTYVNATYDSFDSPPYGNGAAAKVNLAGRFLSSTPKFTGNISAAYTMPLRADQRDGGLRLSLNAYFRSTVYTDDRVIAPSTTVPAYAIVNGRLDLIRTLPFDIGVWSNNLLNKTYAIYKNQTLDNFGLARTDYGEPRSYGVELTYRF